MRTFRSRGPYGVLNTISQEELTVGGLSWGQGSGGELTIGGLSGGLGEGGVGAEAELPPRQLGHKVLASTAMPDW